jgi:pyridoxal phosphate phosphatase PHOSPHO2
MSNSWKLAVFDFDNTIIDLNVYFLVDDLLKQNIPDNLNEIHDKYGWIERMNSLFESNSLNKEKINNILNKILIDAKMKKFLKILHDNGYETIIVSDNNSYFINYILEHNNVREYVKKMYTNEGYFSENGSFQLIGLNEVIYGENYRFDCNIGLNKCEHNICKRLVLKYHFEISSKERNTSHPDNLIYVGDGVNDYCPGLILTETDFFCVRKGHALENILIKNENSVKNNIKTSPVYWHDGKDLIEFFKTKL